MESVSKTSNMHQFLCRVYEWMCFSLIISFITAYQFIKSTMYKQLVLRLSTDKNMLIFSVAFLVITLFIMHLISSTSETNSILAGAMMIILSIIMGCTMSLAVYGIGTKTILEAFTVTAATFGGMSIIGITTKKDLSSWGTSLFGALIALIIVSFIEIFFSTPLTIIVTSMIGVIIFSLFVTFDTNRIVNGSLGQTNGSAIACALDLYLDFINLFLDFVQIFTGFNNNNN